MLDKIGPEHFHSISDGSSNGHDKQGDIRQIRSLYFRDTALKPKIIREYKKKNLEFLNYKKMQKKKQILEVFRW